MAKQKFEVISTITTIIEIDDCLTPDDEWRRYFYNIYSLGEMAEHIVWNKVIQGFSFVEGIAEDDHSKFKILGVDKEISSSEQIKADSQTS